MLYKPLIWGSRGIKNDKSASYGTTVPVAYPGFFSGGGGGGGFNKFS
jgi:hypothetical protein